MGWEDSCDSDEISFEFVGEEGHLGCDDIFVFSNFGHIVDFDQEMLIFFNEYSNNFLDLGLVQGLVFCFVRLTSLEFGRRGIIMILVSIVLHVK